VQLSANPAQYERLAPALRSARETGADVKLSLYTTATEESALPEQEALAETCTEARHRELPSPFIALVDRTWTCFTPHTRSVNEYGILVDDRTHTYVFHWYFLTCLWEVWEPLYAEGNEDPPITYVEIRQCVRDIAPLIEDGAKIWATVEGYDTSTDERVELSGRLVETTYAGVSSANGDEPPISQLAGQVQITIDTGEETYTIGGWGAMLEAVEAQRITITAIEG
jgi:hypothetical protein